MFQNKTLSLGEWQAIMTLAYSAQFEFPLTSNEIKQRLMSAQFVGKVVKRQGLSMRANSKSSTVSLVLAQLVKKKLVATNGWYYWLAGDNHAGWAQLRKKRTKISQQLRQELALVKLILRFFPKVVAAGITGSLAMDNAKQGADLDLILITKPDSLWINRAGVLLMALILGKKIWPWQSGQDRWCLNLWLESDALSLPKRKQCLYTAYEVLQIDWFYDVDHCGVKFFQQNNWISDFLILKKPLEKSVKSEAVKKTTRLMAKMNEWIFKKQSRHLQQRNLIPSENLSLKQAFLHDDISYQQYQAGWQKMIKRVGVE